MKQKLTRKYALYAQIPALAGTSPNLTLKRSNTPLVAMLALLAALCCITPAANAQVIASSFFTETNVQGLTAQCPPTQCENVVVNCDMREDLSNGTGGMLLGVAWSTDYSTTVNTWFQIRDWAGGNVTINIQGATDPDISFVSGLLPSGSNGTQVLLVYRISGVAYLDIYDLNNIGAGLSVTSALSGTTPTPTGSLWALGNASTAPHVDAAYDAGYSPGNVRDMHEFVCAWEDAGTINYYYADILSPLSSSAVPTSTTNAHFSDVAFFTRAGSGGTDMYVAFPYQNTSSGNLEVYEERLSTGATTVHTLHTGVDAYAPRIAAMDEWDGARARWEVAASVDITGGSLVREVYGYNLLSTPRQTNMSSLLAPLYGGLPVAFQTMGACVAAGLGLSNGPAGNVGNNQYTDGFYPWEHDSNYVRHVNPATGALINSLQCYQVNDANSSVDYHWDLNESLAVSNASNTGRDILTAWYNGTNIVYKHSSSNTMAFRQAKPTGVNAIAVKSPYGLQPGDPYTITDMGGRLVKRGQANSAGGIETGDMASGMYLLRTTDAQGRPKAIKFTK